MRRNLSISLKFVAVAAIAAACTVPLPAQFSRETDIPPSECSGCALRQQGIEPDAGAWKTWIIASGDALRLPPPPSPSATRSELQELRAVASNRAAAALEQVRYWDAGAPGMRWIDIANAEIARGAASSTRSARIRSLINAAAYHATIAAWDSKYAWKRRRPAELDRALRTVIPTPASPSYPSEQ